MGILFQYLPVIGAGAGYVHAVGKANVFEPEFDLKTVVWIVAGYFGGLIAQEVISQNIPSLTGYPNQFMRAK